MLELEKNIRPIIESKYENLNAKEKQIANFFIYENLSNLDLSADFVSKRLNTSLATLTRFSKKCGFQGYRQFIYELSKPNSISKNINSNLTSNTLNTYQELLKKTYSLINENQIEKICKLLNKAKKVFIYGQGSSGLVAKEMKLRFMRLGLNCEAITDSHIMKMNSTLVDSSSLTIALSISGKRNSINESLALAKSNGSKTIMITSNNQDDLKTKYDEILLVASKSHLEQGTIITPQFPLLVMIDIIYAFYLDLDFESKHNKFNNTLNAIDK